jgi:FkbM family methyltransferase
MDDAAAVKTASSGLLGRLTPVVRRRAVSTIAHAFRAAGLIVTRRSKHPKTTFLGLAGRVFDVIVDVGANEGQFAISARTAFPSAHLVCVEPQPEPRQVLDTWARRDRNTTVLPVALGASTGEVEMNIHTDHDSSSSLLPSTQASLAADEALRKQRQITVPIARLDDALATVPQASGSAGRAVEVLLKLDVQGYEEQVLLGAPLTLSRARAVILEVCLEPFYQGQASFDGLYRIVTAAGLEYRGNLDQVLGDDGRVMFLDAVFVRRAE